MNRKYKALRFFLAVALSCLTWLAVPGISAYAENDSVSLGGDKVTVMNQSGAVDEDLEVELWKHDSGWYENGGYKHFGDDDYQTANFGYDSDGDKTDDAKVEFGIGISDLGNINTVNADLAVANSEDDLKNIELEKVLFGGSCKSNSCGCGDSSKCNGGTCDTASSSEGVYTGGCVGHNWVVKNVKASVTITKGTITIIAVPVLVQCDKCLAIEVVWVTYTMQHYHDEAVKSNEAAGHTHYCYECGEEIKTESHQFGDWEETADGLYEYLTCAHCGYQIFNKLPVEQPEPTEGNVTYKASYPAGTTTSKKSVIKKKVDVNWVSVPVDGWYVIGESGYYKAENDEEAVYYEAGTVLYGTHYETILDSALNKYTVEDVSATTKTSGAFWTRFEFDYAAGDESGSTKAVNVPTDKTIQYLNYTSDPKVGDIVSYDDKTNVKITVTFDMPVTLATASLKGWTFDGWYRDYSCTVCLGSFRCSSQADVVQWQLERRKGMEVFLWR